MSDAYDNYGFNLPQSNDYVKESDSSHTPKEEICPPEYLGPFCYLTTGFPQGPEDAPVHNKPKGE